jgi:6-phosphogluconolactonase
MKMDTRVFQDGDALSRAALDELLRIVSNAVKERGRFAIALAGGHTPAKLYQMWAQGEKTGTQTPWERVHLFWGDERYVPYDDPASNYRMARESLIAHVPIPASNVHPMPTDAPQPEKAAEAYEGELSRFFGAGTPAFDVQLLGLGVEGHTASLFPGSPALEEKARWVAAAVAAVEPPQRLTLTLPVLNQARNTFFLVTGADKRPIIAALRGQSAQGSGAYPASRVQPNGPVVWFLDEAAAG